MNKKLKIAVVTGTRADYGILKPVIKAIDISHKLDLCLLVTGMHLEQRFGNTIQEIEADGFQVSKKLPINLSADDEVSISKSMGVAIEACASAYLEFNPDIILFLGDRYEIFAAAAAALVARIPVAHISGGDVTEGAIDESMRHSITKMAHLHFVTTQESGYRVAQLGENPDYIFNVGNPSLDALKDMEYLTREEIIREIKFKLKNKNFLITFHPETIEKNKAKEHIEQILTALKKYPDVGLIFTMPNADPEGAIIAQEIKKFVNENKNATCYNSLGHFLYFNVMNIVDVVIGNSSSGLLEAPSFKLPCVNIGNRQKGRIISSLTIQSDIEENKINNAIDTALALDRLKIENPYGDGKSAQKIVKVLENISEPEKLLRKTFFDIKDWKYA